MHCGHRATRRAKRLRTLPSIPRRRSHSIMSISPTILINASRVPARSGLDLPQRESHSHEQAPPYFVGDDQSGGSAGRGAISGVPVDVMTDSGLARADDRHFEFIQRLVGPHVYTPLVQSAAVRRAQPGVRHVRLRSHAPSLYGSRLGFPCCRRSNTMTQTTLKWGLLDKGARRQ